MDLPPWPVRVYCARRLIKNFKNATRRPNEIDVAPTTEKSSILPKNKSD